MKKTIYLLRLWDSQSAKIKRHLFVKSEILIGSDRKCHLRRSDLEGLHASLNFETAEFRCIQTGQCESLAEGELRQLGSSVIQWKRQALWSRRFRVPALSIGVLVFVMAGFWLFKPSGDQLECSSIETKIASGSWGSHSVSENAQLIFERLRQIRINIQRALREEEFTRARAELDELKAAILSVSSHEACGVLSPVFALEESMIKKLVRHQLRRGELLAAAELVSRFRSQHGEVVLEKEMRRLSREAKRLFLKGYRLEDSNAEAGFDMMEQAREACQKLGLDRNCFRS